MDEIDAALERLSAQLGKPELQEWLAIRKEAGQKLDPETAVVACVRRQALDEYEIPAGTLAPDDFPGEWDPMEYVSTDWQAVAGADARALGEAFDRALSTGSFCHIEPVIRRLADFCSGGAFLIT
jgi:hypothetical protein